MCPLTTKWCVQLNQIRKAGDSIQSNHLLWNGWAGTLSLLSLSVLLNGQKLTFSFCCCSGEIRPGEP